MDASALFLPWGYTARADGVVPPPQARSVVPAFVAAVAGRLGARRVVDLGSGPAALSVWRSAGLDVAQVDPDDPSCLETLGSLPEDFTATSMGAALGVLDRAEHPLRALAAVRLLSRLAPVTVLSASDRARASGACTHGPPDDPSLRREWTLDELRLLLAWADLPVAFHGHAPAPLGATRPEAVVVADRLSGFGPPCSAGFRVGAVVTAFNERDVIVETIARLVAGGIEVHLVDNWSTDGTYEAAAGLDSTGMLVRERFPAGGPSETYDWARLLTRVAEVAHAKPWHWAIHHDADEIRESPWTCVGLREGLCLVDRAGYTAVDHSVAVFHPTDREPLAPGDDLAGRLTAFEFGTRPGHLVQIKAWRNDTAAPVDLASSGGHEARFPGRSVFPYRFLLRHYPVRSQEHGIRKILRDRRPRWNTAERSQGWHTHYDHVSAEHDFVRDPATLSAYDPARFADDFLVERLSGLTAG